MIAGIFGLLTDAVSPSPSWAVGWGWVVLAGASVLAIGLGLILIFRPFESSGHRLARQLRPVIDDGQMLFQATGMADAHPEDVHKDFTERVARWEARAKHEVAKHADDYSDALSKAVSGDIHDYGAPGWRPPFDLQRRRLGRSLMVLRAIAAGTPSNDVDLDADHKAREAVEQGVQERLDELDKLDGQSKWVQTPEQLAARIGPNDIIRAFILLRNEGRALRGRVEAVVWGERQNNLAFGQAELDDWLGRCAKAVWNHRPGHQPALERATQQHIPFGN
ncbi:MAG: hypothetical protein IVW53_14120 [Chloroflexi bacterium]|nr:hypothetical protein [Chloroflexota bacterium]